MLPTKGYFQDIECPFYNTNCGRPYCHFRHKRKPNETTEENVQETSKNVVPTYKPTPKSELANIHNSRSHIPISYVPDLSFKRERTVRPPIRIEKPTYKPTPLSLLSSANKPESSLPENDEHQETIKDIQENIASTIYDPLKSEINFEDLSNEFELIDDIINDSQEGAQSSISDNLIRLESDIEKEQNKLNILKSEIGSNERDEIFTQNDNLPSTRKVKSNSGLRSQKNYSSSTTKGKDADKALSNKVKEEAKEKPEKKEKEKTHRSSDSKDHKSEKEKKDHKTKKDSKDSKADQETKASHKDKSKSSDKSKGRSSSKEKNTKETDLQKIDNSPKSHKSSEREKHRKEQKKHCSKDREHSKDHQKSRIKDKERSHSPKEKKSKRNKNESTYDSESSSSDSNSEWHKSEKKSDNSKNKKHKSRHRSRSTSKKREKKSKSSQSRSKSRSVSKEKHKSKHKSRDRSRSRTRHKDEDKKSSKHRQDKEKSTRSRDKSKERKDSVRLSTKEKISRSSSRKSQDKSRKPSSDSKGDTSGDESHAANDLMEIDTFIPSDVDLDFDDEDETMRECYKIFNEYKPEPIKQQPKMEDTEKNILLEDDDNMFHCKKRTAHAGAEKMSSYPKLPPVAPPKTVALPGQVLTNRYKIAKMAQASNEQENIMNEIKNMTQQPVKRPAASLLEAARQHKMKRLEQQRAKEKEKPSANVVDDILNGVHRPSPSQVKVVPKKIAAVANVALLEKAKERISLIKQQRLQNIKTVAQTQKSGRVAHVPEYSLASIPDVIQADKSKLPVNVRTRFLTMIADECSKLYALKDDAYNRALNEEFACYEKCKVLATYRNSAMLAVNRLRKEIQERENKGLGPLLSGENSTNKKETDFEGKTFYNHVKKWVLTEEELDIHGYPRESGEKGRAIINNRTEVDYSIIDDNQRKCSRCGKIYQVDDDGWPLYDEECMYHPLKKRTIRGEQIFLCCKSSDDTGCAMSDTHVFDGTQTHLLEGYQTTLPPESDDDPRSSQVYALDCEMCYTTKGLELTRVTIVDVDCKTVYESLVKPLNPIIDYNTRFSGITKDQMDRTSTSILQVQANILHLCNSETILVGHSLESDMKALKIVHGTIIDTSVLFPHKMGLPHKRALRALASEYLKKIIQNDVAGHDSAEDAVSCMDLIKWKLKEELKTKIK